MKLINQSVELIPQGYNLESMFKHIEIAARNCYKSESLATDVSHEKLIKFLMNKGHLSPLEHGTLYLTIPKTVKWVDPFVYDLKTNQYSRVWEDDNNAYITTNYRVLVELDLHCYPFEEYMVEPGEDHHQRVTARIITDRAIMAEITRHRGFSFSIESTRYCNYSMDKFNKEITCIKPLWYDDATKIKQMLFDETLRSSEDYYFLLLNEGLKAQDARAVLPNALKTDIVMTGYLYQWADFIDKRMNTETRNVGAHPQVSEIAKTLDDLIFPENKLFHTFKDEYGEERTFINTH